MSSAVPSERAGTLSGRNLSEELSALRIERRGAIPSGRRGRGGLGIVTLLVWLIPIAILGGAGAVAYRQYEKIRPKTQVTVGVVQSMTTGEAETLLSAKGYIKSRNQAMIGAKLPGRVEKMLVEEGMRVKKGQLLAVL